MYGVPIVALRPVVGVVKVDAAYEVIVKLEVVAVALLLSVTVTVIGKKPVTVGVPEITPFEKVMPEGSAPDSLHDFTPAGAV